MTDSAASSAVRARRSELVRGLLALLPADSVLYEPEDLRPYECDGLSAYRQLPMVVALPTTAEEVQAVMRLCHRLAVPVVARGAGTGLSGGALPLENGLLLSLARLKSILAIDPVVRTARVQPGVRNLAISEAARPHGLYYAPDPSSQIACTIGGNVAENSGGVHCLKYGLTVHNVLELEVVTVAGERLTIGSDALDAAGYDLLAMMTGSEGLLAVVEVTVRLLPLPERAQVLLAAYDDVARAGAAVGAITAAGHVGERAYVRLAGTEAAVRAARRELGGEALADGAGFWRSVREHNHGFFFAPRSLWRLSLPPASPVHPGLHQFIDWGGAQRWVYSEQPLWASAAAAGGHATRWRAGNPESTSSMEGGEVFQPLPDGLLALHRRLKRSFDPAGILNPGRLYPEL